MIHYKTIEVSPKRFALMVEAITRHKKVYHGWTLDIYKSDSRAWDMSKNILGYSQIHKMDGIDCVLSWVVKPEFGEE